MLDFVVQGTVHASRVYALYRYICPLDFSPWLSQARVIVPICAHAAEGIHAVRVNLIRKTSKRNKIANEYKYKKKKIGLCTLL